MEGVQIKKEMHGFTFCNELSHDNLFEGNNVQQLTLNTFLQEVYLINKYRYYIVIIPVLYTRA